MNQLTNLWFSSKEIEQPMADFLYMTTLFLQKYLYKTHFRYEYKDNTFDTNIELTLNDKLEDENDKIKILHNISYHYIIFFKGIGLLIYSTYKIFIINHQFNSQARKIIRETNNNSNNCNNNNSKPIICKGPCPSGCL